MLSILPLNIPLYHKTTKHICGCSFKFLVPQCLFIFLLHLSVKKLSQVFVLGHFMCYILYTEHCVLFVYSLRWSISGHAGTTESFSPHISQQLHAIWGWGRRLNRRPFLLLTSPRVFGIECSTFQKSTGQHSSPVPVGGNAGLPRCSVFLVSRLLSRLFLLENLCFQSSWPVVRRWGWKTPQDGDGYLHLSYFLVSPVTPVCVAAAKKNPQTKPVLHHIYLIGCLRNSEAPLTFPTAWFG